MIALETVRQEWDDGNRRFEQALEDPTGRERERLLAQLELVTDELRKRIGQTFSLDDLAREYARADRWVRDVVEEHAATPGWPRTLSMVEDAAFHLYQRGAVDYAP